MMTLFDAVAIAIIAGLILALILRLNWIACYPDECAQRRQDTELAQHHYELNLIEIAYLCCIRKAKQQECREIVLGEAA